MRCSILLDNDDGNGDNDKEDNDEGNADDGNGADDGNKDDNKLSNNEDNDKDEYKEDEGGDEDEDTYYSHDDEDEDKGGTVIPGTAYDTITAALCQNAVTSRVPVSSITGVEPIYERCIRIVMLDDWRILAPHEMADTCNCRYRCFPGYINISHCKDGVGKVGRTSNGRINPHRCHPHNGPSCWSWK